MNMTYLERGLERHGNFIKIFPEVLLAVLIFSEQKFGFRIKCMNISMEDFKDYTII